MKKILAGEELRKMEIEISQIKLFNKIRKEYNLQGKIGKGKLFELNKLWEQKHGN